MTMYQLPMDPPAPIVCSRKPSQAAAPRACKQNRPRAASPRIDGSFQKPKKQTPPPPWWGEQSSELLGGEMRSPHTDASAGTWSDEDGAWAASVDTRSQLRPIPRPAVLRSDGSRSGIDSGEQMEIGNGGPPHHTRWWNIGVIISAGNDIGARWTDR
jgi:hypothetical protein